MQARPYQQEALAAVDKQFRLGVKRTIVSMPTGTGKTIVLVFLAHMALSQGHRVLILTHSEEIIKQTYKKLAQVGILPGVVKCEFDEFDRPCVIAQIQTLSRKERLRRLPKGSFDFIIVDEAHLANAGTWQRVLRYFGHSWMVGLTATPFRGDKDSLAWAHFAGLKYANWQSVAYVYEIQRALREGWLARPLVHEVSTGIDLDEVGVRVPKEGGVADFSTKALEGKIDTPERNQAIVEAWIRVCPGVRTVGFCVSQQHALNLTNTFRRNGVESYRIRYGMGDAQRNAILGNHKAGRFPVLTNCAILTHGYDDKALGCVIMARPTLSKTLFMQMAGRGMRPMAGKDRCHLLAAVDSCTKHKIAIVREVMQLEEEMVEASSEAGPVPVAR